MIEDAIRAYRDGAITAYQLMIDALHRLDPREPHLVLGRLPEKVLDELLDYAGRYDPLRGRSAPSVPPSEDQVRAAEAWVQAHRLERSGVDRP